MKLTRRLMAFMLTTILLIGIMPSAMAMVVDCETEGRSHSWSDIYWEDKGQCGIIYGERYCNYCGKTESYTKERSHEWTEWEIAREAPCGGEGVKTRYCQNCREQQSTTYYREHTPGRWEQDPYYDPPTCTEGSMELNYCSVCGECLNEREVPALGHDYGSWTEIHKATCIETGAKSRRCSRCGDTEVVDTDYGDHSWGNWVLIEKGDCTNPGIEQRKCGLCGKTETRDSEEGSHAWGSWFEYEEPTCTRKGESRRVCTLCGKVERKDISAKGHRWGDWKVIQEARPGQVGIRERKCSRCDATEREEFYPEGTLRRGDRGEDVEELQKKLNEQGYDCGEADGIFGSKTEAAMSQWQQDHGYYVDGICWPGQGVGPDDPGADPEDGGNDYDIAFIMEFTEPLPELLENVSAGDVIELPMRITNIGETTFHPLDRFVTDIDGNDVYDNNESNGAPDWRPCKPGEAIDDIYRLEIHQFDIDSGRIYRNYRQVSFALYYKDTNARYDVDPIPEDHDGSMQVRVEENTECVVDIVIPLAVDGQQTVSGGAILEKSEISAPANGSYYVPGEKVEYMLFFVNECEYELNDLEISDPLKGGNEDMVLVREPVVDAFGTIRASFVYTVTEADASAGYVRNTASAAWWDPETSQSRSCYSDTVTVPCGFNKVELDGEDIVMGAMDITKSVVTSPANGSYYTAGETVTFRIEVSNNHPTYALNNVQIHDGMMYELDGMWECMYIDPGMSDSFTFDYVVTPIDAIAGSLTNIAYGNADDAEGVQYRACSNTVTVYTGPTDLPFGVITSMDLVKEETSSPANGSFYTEGETIGYKITYVNTGETMFGETVIYDTLESSGDIASAEMLSPGESRYCTYEHVVTAEDVERGYVVNFAIAKYDVGGGYINTLMSDPVVSDTDGDPDTSFVPGPGTIDWEKLRADEDGMQMPVEDLCFTRPITRNNEHVEYETCFCSKHAKTHEAILLMLEDADTEEKQRMAWEYAYALCLKDIDEMYERILVACDDNAKVTVMNERVTHLAMIANTQLAMKIANPGSPAETAQAIARYWLDKSVELCYLINTSPEDRVDRIFNVARTERTAQAYADCGCAITDETAAKIVCDDTYCAAHSFTYDMMEILLLNDTGKESRESARSLWEIELNIGYNALFREASQEGGMAYLAEYATCLSRLSALQEFLALAYPDDPEIVDEVMIATVMRRVMDVCERQK